MNKTENSNLILSIKVYDTDWFYQYVLDKIDSYPIETFQVWINNLINQSKQCK